MRVKLRKWEHRTEQVKQVHQTELNQVNKTGLNMIQLVKQIELK